MKKGNFWGKSWIKEKGFSSASEAKKALNIVLETIKYGVMIIENDGSVDFYEFYEQVAIPHVKRTLKENTFHNRISMYSKYFEECKEKKSRST